MRVTLKFKTDQGTDWVLTKDFSDKKHQDNFINYIEKTKGYILDEVFTKEKKQTAEAMYLDWFNNFICTEAFRDHYELSLSEAENIIDRGRKLIQLNK